MRGHLFDIGETFESAARGTSGKRFIVRCYALTDGDEIAVADSKPITLITARKLEVRAQKSDCLLVEVFAADAVPPIVDGAKRIVELRGLHIVAIDPDDLFISPRQPADYEQLTEPARTPRRSK